MVFLKIICYVIVGILLIRVIYMGIKHHNDLSKLFQVMYMISSMISGIFVITGIIIDVMKIIGYNRYYFIFNAINMAAIYLFLYAFCCQIYMKLTTAFIGSVYSISKRKHKIIISSLVFQIIFVILSVILVSMVSLEFGILCVIPAFFLYNFISIYMVYTFISTLNKLIKSSARQDNSKMIKTVVRYSISSITAYTSSILFLGLCIVLSQFNKYEEIGYLLVIFDGFANLLALYFQYNFAENDYDICCILCHRLILQCMNSQKNCDETDTKKVSNNQDI